MSPGSDLGALLDRYPLAFRPVGPLSPLGNSGGLSGARLWRYSAPRGEFLLRLWPESEMDAERLRLRLEWVGLLDALPFVPRPVTALDGQALQAFDRRFWHVEPRMPGEAEAMRPPSEVRVRASMEALALVHRRWERLCSTGPSPGLKLRLDETETLASGGLANLRDAVSRTSDSAERRIAMGWIEEAPRLLPTIRKELGRAVETPVTLQPSMRDVRSDHLLFTGDRLTGLVDFGALAIESPASDLARLLADWFEPDDPGRSTALSAYEQVRPMDSRWIALFERSADLLLGSRWIRWHFVAHREFDKAGAALLGLETALHRLRRRIVSEVKRSNPAR